MSHALASAEANARVPSPVPPACRPVGSSAGVPPGRVSRASAPPWPAWTLVLAVGCGGPVETTLPPAENPPANAKERAERNPRMKADFEANSKKARGAATKP